MKIGVDISKTMIDDLTVDLPFGDRSKILQGSLYTYHLYTSNMFRSGLIVTYSSEYHGEIGLITPSLDSNMFLGKVL